MERKLRDYFAAGSKLVWYLDPDERSLRVYTSPDQFTTLDESGTLDGGDVLPGFRLPIREWFALRGRSSRVGLIPWVDEDFAMLGRGDFSLGG